MPHCTPYFTVSANHENMHTPRVVKKQHNSHKVHSLLTHQRNCSSSYGGRRSRRRTAASSIGCAPGEGTALLARALLKQPSLPASLSLLLRLHHHCASVIRHMCQRGVVSCKKTPRGCPAKAAELSSMSVQMLEGGRIWILYSAALPPWARHRVCHLFFQSNFISPHR